MSDLVLPPATLVLATRNRSRDLARALDSIRTLDYPSLEVLIIDQSDGSVADPSLSFDGWPWPVRVLCQPPPGKSRALNLALREAATGILLFTDDDCTVPPGWASGLVAVLQAHPRAGLVFGRVEPVAHNEAESFIPDFLPRIERTWTTPWYGRHFGGLGASMAGRRDALLAIGGFDERLGPGSHYGNSEDTDLAYRLLRRGHHVVHTPATAVHHFGGRPYASGAAREVVVRSYYSFGAMCGRAIRRKDGAAAIPLAVDLVQTAWEATRNIVCNNRPTGLRRLGALASGFAAGLRDTSPRQARETLVGPTAYAGSNPAATLRT